MDEDRIQSIITYIQQNPDVSTELLMQNLMQSGYNTGELKEALRKLDISPIVIPGYKEEIPLPNSGFPLKNIVLILGGILIIIGVFIGILMLVTSQPKKSSQPTEPKTQQQEIIDLPTSTPVASPSGSL